MLLGIVRIGQGVILWFEILIIGKEKPGKSRFGIDEVVEVDIIFFFFRRFDLCIFGENNWWVVYQISGIIPNKHNHKIS